MSRIRVNIPGVHRVRKKLSDGTKAVYHYAWRGGPRFWDHTMPFGVNSIDYVQALKEARATRIDHSDTFQMVINEFFESKDFKDLAPRTQRDHKRNAAREGGIEEVFGKAPIKAFDDPRIRSKILKWRDTFSSGTGDNQIATMQRIISFGYHRGLLQQHHLMEIKKQAKSNRAHVIWMPDEVKAFIDGAPTYVGRILKVAVETGLRPGDLRILTLDDIEELGDGNQRIILRTQKSRGRKYASVPVTPGMSKLLEDLPKDQTHVILNSEGNPFSDADKLGRHISEWRDKLGIRSELRLYDARGTAVTRLVRAGCTLSELAAHMGWSYQHAAQMLERYAALDPAMTDAILAKVQNHQRLSVDETKRMEGDDPLE